MEWKSSLALIGPAHNILVLITVTLPDSFYDLSAAELKAVLRSSGSATSTDAPLMTKAMRDREASLRRQKYPKTMIRVRFPNRVTFQATFLSSEKGKLNESLVYVLSRSFNTKCVR